MARPRRRNRTAVSLFPFLSVLACIIGVLTLLITATAVGEIGGGALDLETYEKLEDDIVEQRRRLAELRALEVEVTNLAAALAEQRAREEALRVDQAALGDALVKSAPLRDELRRDEKRVASLEAELAELEAASDALETKLAERRTALASAPLRLRPSGSGSGLEPHFVECRDDGVLLYEGPELRPHAVPRHRIDSSADVRSFLRRVRARSGASAILLMRPSGVGTCRLIAVEAARHHARHGSMPIPEQGDLDFSAVGGGR